MSLLLEKIEKYINDYDDLLSMTDNESLSKSDLELDVKNLQFENENLRRLIDEKDRIIFKSNQDVHKFKQLNKELLIKNEKLDSSNFFEIEIGKKYQISTERFTNVVIILDQTKDFVKYKGTNDSIYYVNKSSIMLLKVRN